MDKHWDSTAVRGTCPVCERDDITIKKDGTLRTHGGEKYTTWDGRQLREFCKGAGEKPKEG